MLSDACFELVDVIDTYYSKEPYAYGDELTKVREVCDGIRTQLDTFPYPKDPTYNRHRDKLLKAIAALDVTPIMAARKALEAYCAGLHRAEKKKQQQQKAKTMKTKDK